MADKKVKVGAVQFDVVKGDTKANMEKAVFYLSELADNGACFGVLPELFSSGFDNEHIKSRTEETQSCLETLAEFAKNRSIAIAGSLPTIESGQVFNTLYYIDSDGRLIGQYNKLHLFRLTDEHKFYTPGNNAVTLDTRLGRLGVMICYDLRFPELARQLCLEGAKLFVVCAQWPSARLSHWKALIRARAIENQSYFICSNRTGIDEDGLEFPGNSLIVDPDGQILAQGSDRPGSICSEIDMAMVDRTRSLIPIAKDRRKDIYG